MYDVFTNIYHMNQPLMQVNIPYLDPNVSGRNPAPVEVGSLFHYLQFTGLCTSQVVQDFLRQQYGIGMDWRLSYNSSATESHDTRQQMGLV